MSAETAATGNLDRLPDGRLVTPFYESKTMPDTAEHTAIKNGVVRQSKSIPGVGSVRFVAYDFRGGKYAIVRVLESAFRPPVEHQRFVIESFEGYETAASAFGLAVGWLVDLATRFGHDLLDEEAWAQLLEALPQAPEPAPGA